jgi:hypothetical protein
VSLKKLTLDLGGKGQQHEKARQRLSELKKGGAAVQKSRERLSRSNVKNKEGDCIIM